MKKQHLILLFVFTIISSCGIYKSLFSIVYNKFPVMEMPSHGTFETWNNLNLFILRVELEEKNKITYLKNKDSITELSDYQVKDYKLLNKRDWNNENIVEEVYLYLSNFEERVNSREIFLNPKERVNSGGKVLYMSSMPLKREVSKLLFCNTYFLSTYGINHLMTGTWEWKDNGEIKLVLADNDNQLRLEGFVTNFAAPGNHVLEFTHVSHPKPMDPDVENLIEIRDVFKINPNDDFGDGRKVRGIRFFQNTKRTFVHPDWSKLSKRFNYEKDGKYYLENKELRKITKVMIGGNDGQNTYFMINDPDFNSQEYNVIGYRR